jgi:hypothetical protein
MIKPPALTLIKEGDGLGKDIVTAYPFNIGFGNTAYDYCPGLVWDNRNHGTINGATWVPGNQGYSLSLNGTSHNIDTSESNRFNFGLTNFSVSFRARRNTAGVTHSFLGKFTLSPVRGWYIQHLSSNKLFFDIIEVLSTDRITWISDGSFTDTNWHNYTFIRTGTNSIKVFRDGIEVPGNVAINLGTPNATSTATLKIGEVGDGTGFWDGELDNFIINNRALSDEDAKKYHTDNYVMYRQKSSEIVGLPASIIVLTIVVGLALALKRAKIDFTGKRAHIDQTLKRASIKFTKVE